MIFKYRNSHKMNPKPKTNPFGPFFPTPQFHSSYLYPTKTQKPRYWNYFNNQLQYKKIPTDFNVQPKSVKL